MTAPPRTPLAAEKPSTWNASGLRRAIVSLVALKIAGAVLVIDVTHTLLQAFDLPKSAWSLATSLLLVALLAPAFARFGSAILPRSAIHVGVAAVVLASGIATAFAEDRYIALFGTQGRYLGFVFTLDMLVLYVAIATAYRARRDWAILFGAIIVGGIAAGAYGLVQYAGLDPYTWSDDPRLRPFSTLGNPTIFGHLLSVAFAVGVGAFLAQPKQRVVSSLGASLAIASLILSGIVATRGSALGLTSVVVLAIPVVIRAHGLSSGAVRRAALGLGAVAVALILIYAFTLLGARVRTSFAFSPQEGFSPTADRVRVWQSVSQAALDRPIFGWGPDSVAVLWPRYRKPDDAFIFANSTVTTDSAHDWFLQTAVSTGLVGLVASVTMVALTAGLLFFRDLRRVPEIAIPALLGLAAYVAQGLVSVGSVGVDWVPWVAAGVAAALSRSSGSDPISPRVVPSPVAALFLVAAVAAIAQEAPEIIANSQVRSARRLTDLGRPADGLIAADAAVRSDPGRADHWNELGRARFAGGAAGAGVEAFAVASSKAPWDPVYLSNLAIAQSAIATSSKRESDRSLAMSTAARAVEASTNYAPAHATRAEIALSFGQNDVALSEAITGLSLTPRATPGLPDVCVSAAAGLPDPNEGRRMLENAIASRETAGLRTALAALALKMGDREGARDNATRALQLDPTDPRARAILAATR